MSEMRHAMAEQDAAILDYLDGLLRESDVVNANVANLTLISSADAAPAPAIDDDPSDWSLAEADAEHMESPDDAMSPEAFSEATMEVSSSGQPLDDDASVVAAATEAAVSSGTLADQEAPTAEEPTIGAMPAEPVEEIEPSAVMTMNGAEVPEPSPVEDEVPATRTGGAATVDAHYLTLRVGSIKLAFARDEIDAIMRDAEIEPLRGAPEQVAGSVLHDGKRRMVLSLAPVVIGHAAVPQMQTVVMLGGGLWGVAGGEVVEDMVVNIDQVKWRSPMERHDVRPWLAGLSRADGVAIVDTAALRRALAGTS